MSASPNRNIPRWLLLLIIMLCASVLVFVFQYIYFQWFLPNSYGLRESGQFGDTFGAVTAFFTGIGFAGTAAIIWLQLRDIKRREEERNETIKRREKERTRTEELQRRVTTMSMVYDLENEFGSERMRTLRHRACDFFLDAEEVAPWGERRKPTPKDELAVRDTLYFLERVAHFTNDDLVDDDLVLSVFGSRLLMYWKYAKDYILSLEEISSSLRLAELRWLCEDEKGIRKWLQGMNDVDKKRRIEKAPEESHASICREIDDQLAADIVNWFQNRDELHRRLKREYLRSHPRMNKT